MKRLRIAIISDWGRNTEIKYKQARMLHNLDKDVVMTLGDHFYYYGISSRDYERWKTEFTDVFRPDCPWWAILGNHDYHVEHGEAQLFYSLYNSRWIMPASYYEIIHVCDMYAIQFLMLDTVRLAPQTSQRLNIHDMTNTIYKAEHRLAQENWLRQRLYVKKHNDIQIRWRIVCGHYTVYSSGMHGNNDEMIQLLYPHRDQIDLYVCGHDHHTEMSYNTPVRCLISGNGCFFVRPSSSNASSWVADQPMLPIMDISQQKITIDFYDIEKQKINHTSTLYKG